jgi:hypothetical protein
MSLIIPISRQFLDEYGWCKCNPFPHITLMMARSNDVPSIQALQGQAYSKITYQITDDIIEVSNARADLKGVHCKVTITWKEAFRRRLTNCSYCNFFQTYHFTYSDNKGLCTHAPGKPFFVDSASMTVSEMPDTIQDIITSTRLETTENPLFVYVGAEDIYSMITTYENERRNFLAIADRLHMSLTMSTSLITSFAQAAKSRSFEEIFVIILLHGSGYVVSFHGWPVNVADLVAQLSAHTKVNLLVICCRPDPFDREQEEKIQAAIGNGTFAFSTNNGLFETVSTTPGCHAANWLSQQNFSNWPELLECVESRRSNLPSTT